jgi:hypothetical protein
MRVLAPLILAAAAAAAALGAAAVAQRPFRACALPAATAPPADRDARWRHDLAYLMSALARCHVCPTARIAAAELRAAAREVDAGIPGWSDARIALELAALAARLGDAHTWIDTRPLGGAVPLRLTWLDDGVYVADAAPEHAARIGDRVVAIDGRPVAEALAAVARLVSHDTDGWLRALAPDALTRPAVLHALTIAASPDELRYALEDAAGTRRALELAAAGDAPARWARAGAPDAPLGERDRERSYWYAVLPEQRAVYVQYNQCAEDPDRPMARFAAEVAEALAAMPDGAAVVDLRGNGGGDSRVIDPLLRVLRQHRAGGGRLAALIGRWTFSSAVLNAAALGEAGATLIGEPTGGTQGGPGEVRWFRLPASGLRVIYSADYVGDARVHPVAPRLARPPTAADLRAGRDAALEAALDARFTGP